MDLSRSNGSVKKPDWQAMCLAAEERDQQAQRGRSGRSAQLHATVRVQGEFVHVLAGDRGVYSFNFNGDHLMRGENIMFTLRVKVIPYKPVP